MPGSCIITFAFRSRCTTAGRAASLGSRGEWCNVSHDMESSANLEYSSRCLWAVAASLVGDVKYTIAAAMSRAIVGQMCTVTAILGRLLADGNPGVSQLVKQVIMIAVFHGNAHLGGSM